MGERLKIFFTSLIVTIATPAAAVNWEGHENFFLEVMPVPALTEGVAPPLLQQPISCDERRKARLLNTYEQEAIPNVNCSDVKIPTNN